MSEVVAERRQNPKLRELFEEAYVRIEPFLDRKHTWGGLQLTHFALRTLREAYPQLDPTEAHQLVLAAMRVYRERHPDGAGHLSRAAAAV